MDRLALLAPLRRLVGGDFPAAEWPLLAPFGLAGRPDWFGPNSLGPVSCRGEFPQRFCLTPIGASPVLAQYNPSWCSGSRTAHPARRAEARALRRRAPPRRARTAPGRRRSVRPEARSPSGAPIGGVSTARRRTTVRRRPSAPRPRAACRCVCNRCARAMRTRTGTEASPSAASVSTGSRRILTATCRGSPIVRAARARCFAARSPSADWASSLSGSPPSPPDAGDARVRDLRVLARRRRCAARSCA